MIREVQKNGETWHRVVSHTGKSLGEYRSRKAAERRLQQVEMFKAMEKAGTKRGR